MDDTLNNKNWTEWKSFPDPRQQEYLFTPFGYGVYQFYNKMEKQYVLFGRGNNLAYRMTSLLPKPLGQGRRNNRNKRNYVLDNIKNIQYRTIPFATETEMKLFEKKLKNLGIHIFSS